VHGRAKGKHGFTRLTMDQTWGEANTFPFIAYILCLAMGRTPKCHFVMGFPSGSLKIPKVATFATLGAYNFV